METLRNRHFIDGKLRLEYIRTITKDHDTSRVNSMLGRGWYILELEKDERSGEVWYVLGHVEENAK